MNKRATRKAWQLDLDAIENGADFEFEGIWFCLSPSHSQKHRDRIRELAIEEGIGKIDRDGNLVSVGSEELDMLDLGIRAMPGIVVHSWSGWFETDEHGNLYEYKYTPERFVKEALDPANALWLNWLLGVVQDARRFTVTAVKNSKRPLDGGSIESASDCSSAKPQIDS